MNFIIMIDKTRIARLSMHNDYYVFKYFPEFKDQDVYSPIFGFEDMDKEYRSKTLWPFFIIRIPGLKQPKIREILEKEQIDKKDYMRLLHRFGESIIQNEYKLIPESRT